MEDVFRQFREQWAIFDVKTLKDFLSQYDLETRRYVVNKKCPTEEMNALFYFCGLEDESRLTTFEKVEIVKYFLEDCGADVEIPGKEVVHEDKNSVHIAPPLWVTAIRGNIPLAAVLLDHGADVNGRSNSQSAAVRTACYKNDEQMVEFLISKGADVNIPNRYGSTCLMNAVKCPSLVRLLVEKGANVNARETKKMHLTALHYAIHNESLDSFRFLLESGADPSIPDKYGDSPLRSAACFLQPDMVNLLCQRPETNQNDIIEAFELLGASAVDNEKYNYSEEYWLKAVKLRGVHGIQKEVKPTLPVLGPNLEHVSFEDLQTVWEEHDRQRRESVLVKYRILGPLHEEFLYTLLQYGYNRPSNYSTFQIFICAHDLFLEKNKPLHENNMYSLRMIIKVAFSIAYKTSNDPPKPLIVEGVFRKFVQIVDQLQEILQKGKHKTTPERSTSYNNLLVTAILFVKFLLEEEKESERFLTACRRLANINPTFVSKCEANLLHAVLDPRFFNENAKGISTFLREPVLAVDLVHLLLKSRFDVNYLDKERRTCLHRFLRQLDSRDTLSDEENERPVVPFLLEHGVHIDTVDMDGENCLDLLKETGIMYDELSYRSLKCMAALVIGKYKIPYDGWIPFTLNPFMELHHSPEIVKS